MYIFLYAHIKVVVASFVVNIFVFLTITRTRIGRNESYKPPRRLQTLQDSVKPQKT